MIRVAIVEDDPEVAQELQGYFDQLSRETGDSFSVTWCKNAIIFLENYKEEYELVLMDIEMPHMNGMEAARRLREIDKTVPLIFVTNLAQFALKGYEVRAQDFIVKPMKYYGFKMRIGAVVQEIRKTNTEAVIIKTQDGMVRLPIQNLLYVESFEHNLLYHTDHEAYESKGRESLTAVEEKLRPYGFRRCKSSYLVNLHAIKRISGNDIEIGDVVIPIGRTKKKEFLTELAEYFIK